MTEMTLREEKELTASRENGYCCEKKGVGRKKYIFSKGVKVYWKMEKQAQKNGWVRGNQKYYKSFAFKT